MIESVKIGEASKEGFTSARLIKLDNGLMLRTHGDMAWMSKDEKEKIDQQFQEFVDTLKHLGVKVE